ncbi:exocyst complex component Sec3-domain-containing protein [Gongronella butleri]|nr:exocyst complex component Sec3-domain-containing protein [Gongronella butleri]
MSDPIRTALTSSLFTPDGSGAGEKLLIHLKVFEDLKHGDAARGSAIMGKPRYLCLTQKRNKGQLYKTKRSQNGTFSISKSWNLEEIRQIQIIDNNKFTMTLGKRYEWSVEKPRDKLMFLAQVVDLSQRLLNRVPRLVNIDEAQLMRILVHRNVSQVDSPNSPTGLSPSPSYDDTSSPTRGSLTVPPVQTSLSTTSSTYGGGIPASPASSSPSKPFAPSSPKPPSHMPASSSTMHGVSAQVVEGGMRTNSYVSSVPSAVSAPSIAHSAKDDRREREMAREQRREREKKEKEIKEAQLKQKRAMALHDKLMEEDSMMNVDEILTDFNWKTSGNAAVLEKRLLGELHALEAANVHAIIQSDERVQSMVDRIDKSLQELDNMETWLSLYAAELNSMGDDIYEIETQNRGLQILTVNQNNMIKELDDILDSISIPRECLDNLKYDPLDSVRDIERVQKSAEVLQRVLKTKLEDGLDELRAVLEMVEMYNNCSNEFSTRVNDFMVSKIETLARKLLSTPAPPQRKRPMAHPHELVEDALIPYQGFSLWFKEMEPRMYTELQRHYAVTFAPTYERDIREMVDATRPYFSTLRHRSMDDSDFLFRSDESRSARALAYGATKLSSVTASAGARGSFDGHPNAQRANFDEDEKAASDAFTQLITQCGLHVCREQNFMCDFFQQSALAPRSFLERGPVIDHVSDKSHLYTRREKIRDVKIAKKLRNLMDTLFESLEPTVVPLMEYALKTDTTQSVGMMTVVEYQMYKWQTSDQEFVYAFYDSLFMRLRRSFHQFVAEQVRIIEDTKINSKKRRGILSAFRTFPLFVQRLESSANAMEPESQTRQAVNAAYEKIITSMMSSLDTIAKESDEGGDDKEQLNASIMYIENMHHYYHALRSSKLPILDASVKDAKTKYETTLMTYIKAVIRRPLGRLIEFFDGVEVLLRTSTPEEVAFHVNYNKTQLRRVLAMYPPKEIHKSMDQLYKRVDKHFTEEEGLLQVVWRGIQEELIRQHERMEKLIDRCYPDAGVHLEFSIKDLLSHEG